MKLLLSILLLFLSGCISQNTARQEISKCPKYFQDNIGEVKIETFSPLSVIFKGYVSGTEPNGSIHLYAFADKDTVLEESFHSFEHRAYNNRYGEWVSFYNDFSEDSDWYSGYLSTAVILNIPLIDKLGPGGKGKVNFHSTVSHMEDSAECFIFWMRGKHTEDPVLAKKVKAVEKFVTGGY
jgi:hypothetical protein